MHGCLSPGSVPDKLCGLSPVPSAPRASYNVGLHSLPSCLNSQEMSVFDRSFTKVVGLAEIGTDMRKESSVHRGLCLRNGLDISKSMSL